MSDSSNKGRERSAVAGLELCNCLTALAFEVNNNLNRLAVAIEEQTALMQVDIQATIEQGIKTGVAQAVNQAAEDNAKRSYIGKKPT